MAEKQHSLLIVDDNETQRTMLARQLEQLGYQLTLAQNGRQALTILTTVKPDEPQTQPFDVMLLSSTLAEAEIVQIMEQLKAGSIPGRPFVVMTSSAEQVDKVTKYLELGAEEYYVGPFHPVLLKTLIEGCLERKQLREQVQAHLRLLKLEHDIEIGHKIQADFLPKQEQLPQPQGWEIATYFRPARQVAGDFFDVIPLTRGKIGLVIADVCDKGVGPALFMALTRTLIRALAEQHRPLGWMDEMVNEKSGDPKQKAKRQRFLMSSGASALLAVELTNTYITTNHGDMNMFATLFFGVLDPATGTITYVNGGHDAPLLVGVDGVVKTRLMPTGPIVGVMPEATYGIEQAKLEPGELFMAFTDGVSDARNPTGERFTLNNLFPLLKSPFPSAVELLKRIETVLYAHMAEADQYDDITMLAAWRMPTSKTSRREA